MWFLIAAAAGVIFYVATRPGAAAAPAGAGAPTTKPLTKPGPTGSAGSPAGSGGMSQGPTEPTAAPSINYAALGCDAAYTYLPPLAKSKVTTLISEALETPAALAADLIAAKANGTMPDFFKTVVTTYKDITDRIETNVGVLHKGAADGDIDPVLADRCVECLHDANDAFVKAIKPFMPTTIAPSGPTATSQPAQQTQQSPVPALGNIILQTLTATDWPSLRALREPWKTEALRLVGPVTYAGFLAGGIVCSNSDPTECRNSFGEKLSRSAIADFAARVHDASAFAFASNGATGEDIQNNAVEALNRLIAIIDGDPYSAAHYG